MYLRIDDKLDYIMFCFNVNFVNGYRSHHVDRANFGRRHLSSFGLGKGKNFTHELFRQ